jgi:hypothetical protein
MAAKKDQKHYFANDGSDWTSTPTPTEDREGFAAKQPKNPDDEE